MLLKLSYDFLILYDNSFFIYDFSSICGVLRFWALSRNLLP